MSVAHTMPHTENGVTVNFPDANYFQFEGCPAYVTIKSHGVCEVDFVWFQNTANTLWLVELKGFYDPNNLRHISPDLSKKAKADEIVEKLYNKSVHTLCMLQNQRVNTAACHGLPITTQTTYKIVHLLHVHPTYETYLSPLSAELNIRLKTFKALYNVSSVAIVSYQRAVNGTIPLPFV